MMKRSIALFTAVCVLFGALLWRTMEVGRMQPLQATATNGDDLSRFLDSQSETGYNVIANIEKE